MLICDQDLGLMVLNLANYLQNDENKKSCDLVATNSEKIKFCNKLELSNGFSYYFILNIF